jgi:hypothetical protein
MGAVSRAMGRSGATWLWPFAAWAIAYFPRPFVLGFVADDWTGLVFTTRTTRPWSWERWHYFGSLLLNRPLAAPLDFVLSSALGDSPAAWAISGVLVAMVVAVAVRLFLLELSRLLDADGTAAADLATAVWLLAPWSVGATAWAINIVQTLSAALFALSGARLLRGWSRGETPWIGPALLFALSCLVYESFYGQFVVFLGLGAVAGVHRRLGARAFWRPGIALLVVQAAVVWWNRFSPRLTDALVSKSLDHGWYVGIAKNIALMPVAFYQGTAGLFGLVAVLGGMLLVLTARGWRLAPEEVRSRSLAVLVLCALGAVGSVGVLAMAGYRLSGSGHHSRTAFGLSFWFAAMLVPLLVLAAHAGAAGGRLYHLRRYVAGLALAALAVANVARMAEWGRAWQLGRATVAAVPVGDLRGASAGAVVLYVGPWHVAGIVPVGERWAMSPAVWYAHPELRHLRFYAARDVVTRWDGATFEQRPTLVPRTLLLKARLRRASEADIAAYLARLPPELQEAAAELWVWNQRSRRAARVAAPFEYRSAIPGS